MKAPPTCSPPFVLKAAAQSLASLPIEVILTTGGNREPEELDLGPIAPNVRVLRWVSHTELLPHLDLMITSGGSAIAELLEELASVPQAAVR